MIMTTELFIKDCIVPLLVSLSSLVGSLFGGWLSGRKKIGIEVLSKNRQEWILNLRNKVVDFQILSDDIFNYYRSNNDNYFNGSQLSPRLSDLVKFKFYLELMLNPHECKSKDILKNAQEIIEFLYGLTLEVPPIYELDDQSIEIYENNLFNLQKNLTQSAQIVLKEEWERVKKGI